MVQINKREGQSAKVKDESTIYKCRDYSAKRERDYNAEEDA